MKICERRGVKYQRLAILDAVTMREFDALCLPPGETCTPKRLRTRYKASQAMFRPT